MRHSPARILGLLVLALGVGLPAMHFTMQAQLAGNRGEEESITILAGDILEVLPTHQLEDPRYAWVLMRSGNLGEDETFLQGHTDRIFRYRPIQPGEYLLFGDITSRDRTVHIQRTFRITVTERSGALDSVAGSDTEIIATIDPEPSSMGAIVLEDGKQLVRIAPASRDTTNVALDADTTFDSNGDGNPSNDIDNEDSFFQSDATPLYVWVAHPPLSQLTMELTAVQDGEGRTQELNVYSETEADVQNVLESPISIVSEDQGSGRYRFAATFGRQPDASSSLLYRWDFGDGAESLASSPVHSYAIPGEYTVSLSVRNIQNGTEIGTAEQLISVSANAPPSSAAGATSSAAASETSSSEAADDSDGGSMLGTIVTIFGIVALFVALGIGAMFVISRFTKNRKGSLENHIASLEKKMMNKNVQKQAPPVVLKTATDNEKKAPEPEEVTKPDVPAPAPTPAPAVPPTEAPAQEGGVEEEIKDDVKAKEELAKKEVDHTPLVPTAEKPQSPTEPPAPIDVNKAPSWLKSGLEGKTEPAKPAPASIPETTPQAPQQPTAEEIPQPKPPVSGISTPQAQPKPRVEAVQPPIPPQENAPQQQPKPNPMPRPVQSPAPTPPQKPASPAPRPPVQKTQPQAPKPAQPRPQPQPPRPPQQPPKQTPPPQKPPAPNPAPKPESTPPSAPQKPVSEESSPPVPTWLQSPPNGQNTSASQQPKPPVAPAPPAPEPKDIPKQKPDPQEIAQSNQATEKPSDDTPIRFIRAESIEEQEEK